MFEKTDTSASDKAFEHVGSRRTVVTRHAIFGFSMTFHDISIGGVFFIVYQWIGVPDGFLGKIYRKGP